MKRFAKSTQGVTLLEIMLVLAVAAMIIVMSVRYYQSALANQQTNSALQQIQGITAAIDGLAQSTGGSYASITQAAITPLLPANSFTTPWGTTISPTFGSASSYQVSLGLTPSGVCPLLVSKLAQNNHYTVTPATAAACGNAATTVSYTYKANP